VRFQEDVALIHGNSNDPVLIKRIQLKIWSLRDEVEAVVSKVLANNPDLKVLPPEILASIKEEYSYKGPVEQKPGLTLVEGGVDAESEEGGDDLEAAMAAAMGGGAEGEEDADESAVKAEGEEGAESGDDLEAEMAAAMGGAEAEAPAEVSINGPVKVIQRTSNYIPSSKVSRGISILSEVSMDSLYFFGSEKYLEGQSIVIEFQIPKRFVVNADIVYCRPFNIRSRIISDKKVSYRTVARFSFLKEGERTLLRQFIQSIEPEITEAVVPVPKEAAEEGGDDFDGLDGLDF